MKKIYTKGKFIVIDGLDGCGKGTQVKLLANYLFDKNKRNHIFLTREPCGSIYEQEIRKILKKGIDPKDNADLLTKLFIKDRRIHIRFIKQIIFNGIHVVSDRYKYSTLAYQRAQGDSLEKLIKMHKGMPIPDVILILDVSANSALERIAKDENRKCNEVFEKREFQEKVRKNFLSLPKVLPKEKIIIINGNKPVDKVFGSIKKEVDKIFI